MNRYLKLVHLEVRRFRYVLFGLMALTLLIQSSVLVWKSRSNLALIRDMHAPEKLSFAKAIGFTQFWFSVPVLVSITVLCLYIFLIWYRDWAGRDRFAYRLLALPTARRNVYLAKATAIHLFVFSMVAFQLLALLVERLLFNMAVPSVNREPSLLVEAVKANQAFGVLLPTDFTRFVVYYGLGMAAVCVFFTAVLLERSYRWRGIVYALLHVAVCGAAALFGLQLSDNAYLYGGEVAAIRFGIWLAVMAASLALGFRLVAKKITV